MDSDDLDRRLAVASHRLAGLGDALEGGEPWPLAARFDHAPEATWGPREILAHVAEMLAYWLGEAERIIGGDGEGSPTFGRTTSDDRRLAIIGRDRNLPVHELVARSQVAIERWQVRWAELNPADRERTGTHVALGVLTVTDIATRFATGHLEDHLDQLAAAEGGHSSPG